MRSQPDYTKVGELMEFLSAINPQERLSKYFPQLVNPTMRLDVTLVENGYQADVYLDGKEVGSQCRDFAGDHRIEFLQDILYSNILKMITIFRAEVDSIIYENPKTGFRTSQSRIRKKGGVPYGGL